MLERPKAGMIFPQQKSATFGLAECQHTGEQIVRNAIPEFSSGRLAFRANAVSSMSALNTSDARGSPSGA